ncbi:hypothetical protein CBR_g32600 [Chara braunii]|uniref:DUF659 domain-containing protein n=1 Tax=Chara braunii TaxID=69332 RepID=A0A388LH12_CHABU|nr:hypothetical protein CBR_g32600 [Chara braunii]|eukprot:GBG81608.1 hypothetical protein CBR_g32600 [Chara braunii]
MKVPFRLDVEADHSGSIRLKSLDIKLADITAFVTDSASSNVSAMEVFQKDESVKHIFWIPCVAHVMDLILEDIGGIDWVATRIAQARLVTKFFKRHSHAREVLQAFTMKALLLPAETRFRTHVIMMRRLLLLQSHLMQVVVDDQWKDTVWSTKKIRDDDAEGHSMCRLSSMMVDSDTRQIGKILRRYDKMIARCLSACAALEKYEQDALLEVFDRRRTMFKSPAHVAAMMLDPEFRDRTMPDDEEMQHGLKLALIQFGYPEHSNQHNEVLTAIDKFHSREPPFGDVAMDRAARSYTHPACFWESKEKRFPHTAFFAGRILRVWATASPCERAWSRWSFIHSKSRNRLEVAWAEKLVRCHWNLRLLDRQGMSDDAPSDRPHPYGSWVHYWQQVEEEVPTDQQLVADRGAHVTVTKEELTQARERMRVVSRMGATRRLRESDRRRCRGGGRGGGRRGGRGRGGRGGPGGRRSVASRGRAVYELVRKPRQRWEEGDFLYESSSSDDEDFFGTGRPAQDGDNDFDDRHPNVGDDDGANGDDHGDGGDRPRPAHGDTMRADGAGGEHRTAIPVSEDSFSDHGGEEWIELHGGSGHPRGDTSSMHATAPMGPSAAVPESQQGSAPLMRHPEVQAEISPLPAVRDEGSVGALHPLTSAGAAVSVAATSNVGQPLAEAEQESMLPPRSVQPRPLPALMEGSKGTVVVCQGDDLLERDISHTPAAEQSAADHVGLACPTGSLPGTGEATVLPTVAFYASGKSTGGMDEQGVRNVGRPSAPSMGKRSIGSVDGARHTAMAEFEDRHGSALPTKTSDVHATRAAKASLSRARKKASARKASRSSSHMRSRERGSGVVHLEDGEIAPDGDTLDVGGRDATTADIVGREGTGNAVTG